MFLENSRYVKVKTATKKLGSGRIVTAVMLRRLPAIAGDLTTIKGNDRLDIISQRKYSDATRYWHIADANTELDAAQLVKPPDAAKGEGSVKTIRVPAK